jgi:hypothetical protein
VTGNYLYNNGCVNPCPAGTYLYDNKECRATCPDNFFND